jgi:hypothetical protein
MRQANKKNRLHLQGVRHIHNVCKARPEGIGLSLLTPTAVRNKYVELYLRDSVVGIAIGYGVGVRVPVGSRIISSSRRPGRLWGPPNLLSNWYGGKAAGG